MGNNDEMEKIIRWPDHVQQWQNIAVVAIQSATMTKDCSGGNQIFSSQRYKRIDPQQTMQEDKLDFP